MAVADEHSVDGASHRSVALRHPLSPLVAIDAATLAAAKATSLLDHSAAARHLAVAVERSVVADVAPGTRFELAHALGRAHWRAGHREAAAAAFDEAWRLAEQIGDADRLARAATGGGFSLDFSGETGSDRADRCRIALDRLGDGDSASKARLLADLAASLVVDADRVSARQAATAATEMARRTEDPLAIGYALVAEQFLNQGPTRLAERTAAAGEIMAIAAGTREHPLEVLGRFCLIGTLLEAGDPGLDAEIEAQTVAVRRLREPGYRRHDLWFRCMRALLDGSFAEADRLAREGFDAAMAASDPDALLVYGGQVSTALWMQAREAETAPTFDLMRTEEPNTLMWPAVLAAIHSRSGDVEAARLLLRDLTVDAVPDDRHTLVAIAAIGEAAAAVGDRRKAEAAYDALLPYADRMIPLGMGVASWGPVAHQLGLLARALGEVESAVQHLESAVAVAERLAAVPWIAWCELDLAAAEALAGRDRVATRRRIGHASALAARCGLTHLVDRAATLTDSLD